MKKQLIIIALTTALPLTAMKRHLEYRIGNHATTSVLKPAGTNNKGKTKSDTKKPEFQKKYSLIPSVEKVHSEFKETSAENIGNKLLRLAYKIQNELTQNRLKIAADRFISEIMAINITLNTAPSQESAFNMLKQMLNQVELINQLKKEKEVENTVNSSNSNPHIFKQKLARRIELAQDDIARLCNQSSPKQILESINTTISQMTEDMQLLMPLFDLPNQLKKPGIDPIHVIMQAVDIYNTLILQSNSYSSTFTSGLQIPDSVKPNQSGRLGMKGDDSNQHNRPVTHDIDGIVAPEHLSFPTNITATVTPIGNDSTPEFLPPEAFTQLEQTGSRKRKRTPIPPILDPLEPQQPNKIQKIENFDNPLAITAEQLENNIKYYGFELAMNQAMEHGVKVAIRHGVISGVRDGMQVGIQLGMKLALKHTRFLGEKLLEKVQVVNAKLHQSENITPDYIEFSKSVNRTINDFMRKHFSDALAQQNLDWLFKLLNESHLELQKLIPRNEVMRLQLKSNTINGFLYQFESLNLEQRAQMLRENPELSNQALLKAIELKNLQLFTVCLQSMPHAMVEAIVRNAYDSLLFSALIAKLDERCLGSKIFSISGFKQIVSRCPRKINPIKNGETLLHGLVDDGNKQFCKILLEHGADANTTDHDGDTPIERTIFTPIRNAKVDCFKILLPHMSIEKLQEVSKIIIDLTEQSEEDQKACCDLLKLLKQQGFDFTTIKQKLIHNACENNLSIVTQWLLEN